MNNEREKVLVAMENIRKNIPEEISKDELSIANYLIGYLEASIYLHLNGSVDLRDTIESEL